MTKRDAKEQLATYLAYAPKAMGITWELKAEYRFHPVRKWRFDWCWPDGKIAVEYDGIMMRTVGHNSLAGILRDAEKVNEAQLLGWRVFRANAKNVDDGSFFTLIENVLMTEALAT